jgi:hypothetical protein
MSRVTAERVVNFPAVRLERSSSEKSVWPGYGASLKSKREPKRKRGIAMVGTMETRKLPVHRITWIGFALSLVALVLAWYGSLHAEKHVATSPLRNARAAVTYSSQSGPWYERVVDRTEASLFGESLDRKILALTERSKIARYCLELIAFGLPFVLGITAALIGATAMRTIEQSRGQYCGNFQAVFSILIGGFASVISGCMIVSIFIWPLVPSLYTR